MVHAEYPLTLVARRTGLSPQLIRAWESRHQAVKPRRSSNGRRVYTEADITRLQQLRTLTTAGFPIGRIAHFSEAELAELVTREGAKATVASAGGSVEGSHDSDPGSFVAAALDAISQFDGAAFVHALEDADVSLGKPAFLEEVVAVLAEKVGEAWRTGELKVAHEHFATAELRGYLGPFGRVPHPGQATPHLIVTTPSEQWHELGALLVAAAAHSHGWRVTYLGPSTPTEEIAGAALGYRARAVALSIVYPEDDPHLSRELARLQRLLPKSTSLIIGGRGSHAYAAQLNHPRTRHLLTLRELYPVLEDLRRRPLSAGANENEQPTT